MNEFSLTSASKIQPLVIRAIISFEYVTHLYNHVTFLYITVLPQFYLKNLNNLIFKIRPIVFDRGTK